MEEITNEQVRNFINNEILVLANNLIDKLFDLCNYSIYDVADNLYYSDNEESEDQEMKEIYQWFIVTEYAYNKLSAIYEVIYYCEELDFYFWGRTCYGQLIELDGTIQRALSE